MLRPRLLLPTPSLIPAKIFYSLWDPRAPAAFPQEPPSRFPRSPRRLPFLPVPSLLDRWAALQWDFCLAAAIKTAFFFAFAFFSDFQ